MHDGLGVKNFTNHKVEHERQGTLSGCNFNEFVDLSKIKIAYSLLIIGKGIPNQNTKERR